MKFKVILIIPFASLLTSMSFGQASRAATSIAPFFSFGVSDLEGAHPEGFDSKLQVAANSGVIITQYFNKIVGASLAVSYDKRSFYLHDSRSPDFGEFYYTFNSLSIQPSFIYEGLSIGINFNISLSGSKSFKSKIPIRADFKTGIANTERNTVIDLHIGYSYVFAEFPSGKLGLYIQGSYPLVDALKEFKNPQSGEILHTKIVTAHGGLLYYFNLN